MYIYNHVRTLYTRHGDIMRYDVENVYLYIRSVKRDHGVPVQAKVLDDLLHGLLANENGPDVVEVALVLLDVRLPFGLEVTGAAVVGLLIAVHNQMAPQIRQVARHIRTLLATEGFRVLGRGLELFAAVKWLSRLYVGLIFAGVTLLLLLLLLLLGHV